MKITKKINIDFHQRWTSQEWKLGDIIFFKFAWEIANHYTCLYIVILNFEWEIDIG